MVQTLVCVPAVGQAARISLRYSCASLAPPSFRKRGGRKGNIDRLNLYSERQEADDGHEAKFMKNAVARLAGIAWQIRQPVAAMLSVVLALPAQAETASIRELALGTQIGSTVEVRLAGKDRPNKLRGRMGLLDNQAFDLFVENSCGEPRSIPFEQVKSLRLVKKMRAEPVERSPTLKKVQHALFRKEGSLRFGLRGSKRPTGSAAGSARLAVKDFRSRYSDRGRSTCRRFVLLKSSLSNQSIVSGFNRLPPRRGVSSGLAFRLP